MRKLAILKSLVDFIWIVTCIPLIPVGLFLVGFTIFGNESPSWLFKMIGINFDGDGWMPKLYIAVFMVLVFVMIYSFYLFRKSLRYFQRRKPFDMFVIRSYHKIGNLLVYSGLSLAVLIFLFKLILKSKFELYLGISPYLSIICLGLFFIVLSETFKIAKAAKEENDLTV